MRNNMAYTRCHLLLLLVALPMALLSQEKKEAEASDYKAPAPGATTRL
jgi:hypothetical protein